MCSGRLAHQAVRLAIKMLPLASVQQADLPFWALRGLEPDRCLLRGHVRGLPSWAYPLSMETTQNREAASSESGVTVLMSAQSVSRVQLFATPWTVAHQALLSRGFSRKEYLSWLPHRPPGDLPNPGIKPASFMSLALAGGFFTTSTTWEALLKLARSMITFRASVQRFKFSASSFSSHIFICLGYSVEFLFVL